MKKKNTRVKLNLEKKVIFPLTEQKMYSLRGGGASEVDPFTCLSYVRCSNSKNMFSCKC